MHASLSSSLLLLPAPLGANKDLIRGLIHNEPDRSSPPGGKRGAREGAREKKRERDREINGNSIQLEDRAQTDCQSKKHIEDPGASGMH